MSLVSSVRWVAISQAARLLSQFVSITVLARLLPPDSYGLMAMAMTVTNLVFLFRDMGTCAAIIQRKDLSDSLTSTVYWVNVGLGTAFALLLAVSAPAIALVFKQERLASVILVLALVFPISSLSLVHQALMEREGQFRTLARIEAVSAFCGVMLAIVLGANGAGIWSLVLQMLFSTILTTAQLLLANNWKPRRRFDKGELQSILGFGAHLSLSRLLNYLEQNADSIIIGRVLGSVALGVYSVAYKVMLFPLQNLTVVVSRALFPTMSRHQGSLEALGKLYLRSLGTICIITAPLMAGVFFLREPFVAIVFGPNWSEAVDVLKWLAPVGFIQSITAGTGVVFLARGMSHLLLWFGVLGAVLQVGAFVIGVRWGVEGVAACYFVANLLNLFPCFCASLSVLRIPLRDALMEVGKPVAAAGLMLLFLSEARSLFGAFGLLQTAAFSLYVGLGALAYAFALLVLLRQDISDIRALVKIG